MTQRKSANNAKDQKPFIWLFGENLGNTMNNNSWYAFLEALNDQNLSDIDSYFVLARTSKNLKNVRCLNKKCQRHIVWRNSKLHKDLYRSADVFFVTLSYRDILPDAYGSNNKYPKPTVYLQHGICAIKRIGYKADTYKNSLIRFVCYGKREPELMQEFNGFRKYQTLSCPAMPRWKELIRLDEECKNNKEQNHILWFITWRDYLKDNSKLPQNFLSKIAEVLSSDKLSKWLSKNDLNMTVCLHHLFNTKSAKDTIDRISGLERCTIKYQANTDIMREIAKSKFVITDYSSIGFDATMLGKTVLLYQPDRTRYSMGRSLYIDLYSDMPDAATNPDELIKQIVKPAKHINQFFAERLNTIDKKKILDGTYTKLLLEQLGESTRNKITFIGYNFYGTGGTVSATKALAEGLMEKGYIVDLLSLKKTRVSSPTPPGVIIRNLYHGGKSIASRVKRLAKSKKYLGSLQMDVNSQYLVPYTGIGLRRYLAKTNSSTVVSTRETIHPFLSKATNNMIRNRIYYFHTDPKIVEEYYPGIMTLLCNLKLDKLAFTTDESALDYKHMFNIGGNEDYAITGNSLQSSQMLSLADLEEQSLGSTASDTTKRSDDNAVSGVSLIRISTDRKNDIKRIVQFGQFLKKNKVNDIEIKVYGKGDYCDEFIDEIDSRGIGKYIHYMGSTSNPSSVIRKADFVVDFAMAHSFGMTYIEAILNGKICFATKNNGSDDVLSGIPDCIYASWDDLVAKIHSVPTAPPSRLRKNYKIVNEKYGRKAVADRFEKLIKGRNCRLTESTINNLKTGQTNE